MHFSDIWIRNVDAPKAQIKYYANSVSFDPLQTHVLFSPFETNYRINYYFSASIRVLYLSDCCFHRVEVNRNLFYSPCEIRMFHNSLLSCACAYFEWMLYLWKQQRNTCTRFSNAYFRFVYLLICLFVCFAVIATR